MTGKEFFERCEHHDWFYMMSDDQRWYSAGAHAERELKAACAHRPELKRIYDAWSDYMFSGPAYGTPRPEKPKMEDYCGN